jgi:conjugal transfer mating pair stabilization protein TraN
MHDTLGQGQSQMDALNTNLSDVEKQLVDHCTPDDEATDFRNNSGQCVYLGDYCAESWPLVGCVQKSRSYCCFNSMLARIIQQQGRLQLSSFPNGFGTPTAPKCRGFTPQEFQSLDFSKINLSEYASQIQTNSQSNIQSTVNGIATQEITPH